MVDDMEPQDNLQQYSGAFEFMRSLGLGGGELADFIRTYGLDVSAVQLRLKTVQLKKFLQVACELQHVGAALREVQLRRAGKRVGLDSIQRANINQLLDLMRTTVGTQQLARRLGISRQAIYSVVAEGGPGTVTGLVVGLGNLLGYETITGFLAALQEGVPSIAALRRKDFIKPRTKNKQRTVA